MQQQWKMRKSILIAITIIFIVTLLFLLFEYTNHSHAHAEEIDTKKEAGNYSVEKEILVMPYLLEDNSGYYESEGKCKPLLNKKLINLSVHAQSGVSKPEVQTGKVCGYNAYGITGQSVDIRLSYNFGNPDNLLNTTNDIYSISSDTSRDVADFKDIGVIGKGALLIQKKTNPQGAWEWQNKDGETKNQLHTFDFTELVKLKDYFFTGKKYILYTPSGDDLSKGVYIKITFAYEVKKTSFSREKGLLGFPKDVTTTTYYNILETAEFYMVQNSGEVLFHNASNFKQVDTESESGALSVDKFDTILDGDVTLNGFRLDTMGVSAYDITYKRNDESISHAAYDGDLFYEQGRYDFTIKTKLGNNKNHTIFVDRREINDAIVGYFGQTLFTSDSKRIYTTGQYPAYVAGAKYHLNATDGTFSPVVGKLYRITEKDEKVEETFVKKIKQGISDDYTTEELNESITEPGLYKAEFWNNPKCLENDPELSGDIFHFVFRFQIVEADAKLEPTINEAYLNGLIGFSDLNSKYYSVKVPTKGEGNAIFAFADYGGAYDFAYDAEREKINKTENGYEYKGTVYGTQYDVLGAIDLAAKDRVAVKYFDATDPASYQTADISGEKLTELNYDSDIVVFNSDAEQEYLKVGLPFLNGRKFRYVMPADAELNGASPISEGVVPFAFVKVDDFETQSITLTFVDDPEIKYNIIYGTSVEYQLGLQNAPSGKYKISEHNTNNGDGEYEAIYIRPGDMTSTVSVSLYSDGAFKECVFDKDHLNTERNVSGFIINSITNELDPYSIVKIMHDGETSMFSISEVSNKRFSEGGVYDFDIVDRLGNEMRFTIVITAPVGNAEIHLQLDEKNADIQTEYEAFVGQEIDLPTLAAKNELFVFDGWIYNDTLITNGKFSPSVSGDIYIWPQFTQKYTYIDFDSDGGVPVERIKAEIGKEIVLPTTTKDGKSFGGWEYGGNIYNGTYTPTTASHTFVAVWNFIKTDIELYDGNLLDVITANVGDKVVLPFPSRTGYTFFGWRLDLGNGQNKIYYGQITKLENVENMRLDALWIHNSAVEQGALARGNGGRTAIYFIDGTVLEDDTITTSIGTSIATPAPSRAGYVFVGWVWRTTPISGKIYSGETMTVPQNEDGKIVLEALWIARAVNSGTYASGSIDENISGGGMIKPVSDFITHEPIAFASIVLSVIVAAMITLKLTRKKGFIVYAKRSIKPVRKCPTVALANEKSDMVTRRREYETRVKKNQRLKAFISGFRLNPLSATVCTALFMTVLMALTGVMGTWERSTVAVAETVQTVSFDQSRSVDDEDSEQISGGNFTVETNVPSGENQNGISSDYIYTKNDIQEITQIYDINIELSEDEEFLYSLILLDLLKLGYEIFIGNAIFDDNVIVQGLAFTDFTDAYIQPDKYAIGTGFIAFPNQQNISEYKYGNIIYPACTDKNSFDSKSEFSYILSFAENIDPKHYIYNNHYCSYYIKDSNVFYIIQVNDSSRYNSKYGILFNYDENRVIYDPNLDKDIETVTATSINTLLDPVIAENEYNRYIAEQTANGFTVDTMNFVYISYTALEAYQLGNQDESLLGVDVQEFYDMERTLGPNEYYTVDANGKLTKLEFPPIEEEESKADWLDRLYGAILSIGIMAVGIIIVATVSVVSCGAATAAAPYIMGAFIGAGMEVFMQTVIQGKPIKDINWLRVGIAAVSGVVSAIPGVGWLGAGLIQGATEAAMTAVDGGNLEDVLKAFTVGFVTGVVIHGVGKALSKMKFCFVAGTPVLMAAGYSKAIENVYPGDTVKSYNQVTGKVENKRVLQTFENEIDEIVTVITNDGQEIVATPGHKFYANNKWIAAEDLRAGDILVSVNGEKVVVEKIQHEILESPIKVYNFEVQDNNTYIVGNENGVVVHNSVCSKTNSSKSKALKIDDSTSVQEVLKGRKGSIMQEFPRQYLDSTIGQVRGDASKKVSSARKALKLLFDGRFKK